MPRTCRHLAHVLPTPRQSRVYIMRHGNFIRPVHLVPGSRLSLSKTRFASVGGTSCGLHMVFFIPYLAGVQFSTSMNFCTVAVCCRRQIQIQFNWLDFFVVSRNSWMPHHHVHLPMIRYSRRNIRCHSSDSCAWESVSRWLSWHDRRSLEHSSHMQSHDAGELRNAFSSGRHYDTRTCLL
jgi:hypothetical protein